MKRKEVEDVMGGKGSWDNVDQTDGELSRGIGVERRGICADIKIVRCKDETCDGTRAFFYQVQIRSADEPMTVFYKCTVCGTRWREG